MLKIQQPVDTWTFIAEAIPWLLHEEATNCLMISFLHAARRDPGHLQAPYLATARGESGIVAIAMHTGMKLLLSHSLDPAAMASLVENVHNQLPAPRAVLGRDTEAEAFADSWRRLTGNSPRLFRRQRIYRLDRVHRVGGVPGQLRHAGDSDRDLLVGWAERFGFETGDQAPRPIAEDSIGRHIEGGTLFVWEHGEVVSMAAAGGETPNGARINLVYTPSEYRRRGYATACVAAVSQQVLDRGKRFCFLYTDLTNTTTNHIYQEIGYQPVCDVKDYQLTASGSRD